VGDARWAGEERRRRIDRRDPTRAYPPLHRERRQGPRRLRRSGWRELPTLLLALVAGLLTALIVGRPTAPTVVALTVAPAAPIAPAEEGEEGEEHENSAELRAAQGLRDGAEALTRAELELDERAVELWLPRLVAIEDALANPGTSARVRGELENARRALLGLGLTSM